MDSTALVAQQTLTYWPALRQDEQAFVAAYIENSYSLHLACGAIGKNTSEGKKLLQRTEIKRAISEVQAELDGIDFLNEKWVKAQLLRLFPMVMGDEPVPIVTQAGDEMEVYKFNPEVAMRIVEYVAPKTQKTPAVSININNLGRLSDEQLEKIAASGRVVSEQ